MKPKQPIKPYKIGECITCGRMDVPVMAKRCLNYPHCYSKHRQSVNGSKAEQSGTEETKLLKTAKNGINRQSDARKKKDAIYSVMARLFKKQRQACEARLKGCDGRTIHVHHPYSGSSRDKYYLDTTTWIPVCNHCHHLIHDVMGKEELFKLGLKKTY